MDRLIPRLGLIIGEEEKEAISRGNVSENVINKFEDIFAKSINTKHAFATYQCRTAILLLLKALNLGKEDEVIVPSFVCDSVVEAIIAAGNRPVLADIEPLAYTLDPASFQRLITQKTRAVIAIHTYGHPCEMDTINQIANPRGITVIEDCAQALGAKYKDKPVGTIGDASVFSFGFDKNMTTGIGGMIVTSNDKLAALIREKYEQLTNTENKDINIVKGCINRSILMSDFNKYKRFEKVILARDIFDHFTEKKLVVKFAKMVPIAALIGITQLKRIDRMNELRIANARRLTEGLTGVGAFEPPHVSSLAKHVFLRYTVKVNTDDPAVGVKNVVKQLRESGIEAGRFVWKSALHQKPRYKHLTEKFPERFINTDDFVRRLINIPVHPLLSEKDIEVISETLKRTGSEKLAE